MVGLAFASLVTWRGVAAADRSTGRGGKLMRRLCLVLLGLVLLAAAS
jgi:hypothetical protein